MYSASSPKRTSMSSFVMRSSSWMVAMGETTLLLSMARGKAGWKASAAKASAAKTAMKLFTPIILQGFRLSLVCLFAIEQLKAPTMRSR